MSRNLSQEAHRARERELMVEQQIRPRGVADPRVLQAMATVPRELFVSPHLEEFAYADNALPLERGQTISQPYIVAKMVEALGLEGGERVLEVGAGSGYGAAVLGQIAGEVYAIERYRELADEARERLSRLGYDNVYVAVGDGSRGLPEAAPFDAIVVTAGAPAPPPALRRQLAIGGRMVVPVGRTPRAQALLRITRKGEDAYREQELGVVAFVPLVGAEGFPEPAHRRAEGPVRVADVVARAAEPMDDIEDADLAPLLDRIGEARVVLLGESTHGTSEFYRMRARITQELILRKGFTIVAAEADWPDAARVDDYVRHFGGRNESWRAFSRFPTWMWRNSEFAELAEWLRAYNAELRDPGERVAFRGLDLYSLYTSIDQVVRYLDDVDPEAAQVARARYGCLEPFERDPATYGRAAITGRYRACEAEVVQMLQDLFERQIGDADRERERYLDAVYNARLIAHAERYYRTMYYGSVDSWNLRDEHMFETLERLLEDGGPESKIVVWEHNSHVGDARATEMAARGEHNVGSLCRARLRQPPYLVGFGTHTGTVAAAHRWGGEMNVMDVRPSHERSYERIFHEAEPERFLLPLRDRPEQARVLTHPRLERAIGVVYRPESELASHYFEAVLPRQFDEFIWFNRTRAIEPLEAARRPGMPETYPFGL